MQRIIRDLFHGNLPDSVEIRSVRDREADAFLLVEKMEEQIKKVIPEEHHVLLKELADAHAYLRDACCENEFVIGYRLGVRMMMATWPEANET